MKDFPFMKGLKLKSGETKNFYQFVVNVINRLNILTKTEHFQYKYIYNYKTRTIRNYFGRTINGVGEEIHQYLFSVQKNRKQVNSPVKLKSTKIKSRSEITCLTLMILNYYLIYKTKILY